MNQSVQNFSITFCFERKRKNSIAMAFPQAIPLQFSPNPQYMVRVQAPDFSFVPAEGIANSFPTGGLLICFKLNENCKYYYRTQRNGNDAGQLFLDGITFGSAAHNNLLFCARLDHLQNVSAEFRREELSRMLNEAIIFSINIHRSIVQTMEHVIVSAANRPEMAALGIIPVLVEITIWNSHDITDFVNDGGAGGPRARWRGIRQQQRVYRRTSTARSVIESLPEVKIEDLGEAADSSCTICLEGFEETAPAAADAEIISMPCNHLFHRKCINHWLQISNLCPVCRFQLPVEEPSRRRF